MGSQSQVQLYNEALLSIGGNVITSTTETSPNAVLCNRFFESCRDYVTVNSRWNSAQAEATVTATSDSPLITVWTKKAALPTDPYCLRVLDCYVTGVHEDFEIVGREIYSNTMPMKIRYLKRITDLSSISPAFFQAMVRYLAYKLAYPLTKQHTVQAEMLKMYDFAIRDARLLDAQEGVPVEIRADALTIDRFRS